MRDVENSNAKCDKSLPSSEHRPGRVAKKTSIDSSLSSYSKIFRPKENWTQFVHISSSKLFLLQTLCVWLVLCVPGNVIASFLYYKVTYSDGPELVNLTSGRNLNAFEGVVVSNLTRESCRFWSQYCGNYEVEQVRKDCEASLKASEMKVRQIILHHMETIIAPSREDHTEIYKEILSGLDCAPRANVSILFEPTKGPMKVRTTAASTSHLQCHEVKALYAHWVAQSKFWVEGVAVTIVGAFGLAGNVMAIIILRRIKSNRNFNNLLITLSFSDFLLILNVVVEMSVIGIFMSEEPHWFRVSYPYVLHPLRGFIQTMAIYMVVAVSTERFKAVCYPLAPRQSYQKFVFVAIICSMTLELPRFFEFKLIKNNTDYWTTDLMEDPNYIQLNSYWNELFATGALPLMCLMYMNFKIYRKIRASANFAKRFVSRNTSASLRSSRSVQSIQRCESKWSSAYTRNGMSRTPLNLIEESGETVPSPPRQAPSCTSPTQETTTTLEQGPEATALLAITPTNIQSLSPLSVEGQPPPLGPDSPLDKAPFRWRPPSGDLDSGPEEISLRPLMHMDSTCSQSQNRTQRRRREKSTIVLVSIVLIFLLCHTYRLSLRIYEVSHPENNTLEHYRFCQAQGLYHVPVAFYVLVNFHHLFLVINSSVNFIIYCCVGKEFRALMFELCSRCST